MHEKLKTALKYMFDAALRSGYCILIFKPVQLVLLRSAELYPPRGERWVSAGFLTAIDCGDGIKLK